MLAIHKRKSILVTSGGPPQQNVVSFWFCDPCLSWNDVLAGKRLLWLLCYFLLGRQKVPSGARGCET